MTPFADARPRFVPEALLPAYSYVPGRFPHPVSNPAGHSYGKPPERPPAPDPVCWCECRAYLIGIDLFNFGYYWEAHEVWEGLWRACGQRGPTADFFRGLIKLAAAGVKVREGVPSGVDSHSRRAEDIFQRTADRLGGGDVPFFGLRLGDLLACCRVVAAMAPAAQGDRDEKVRIVFPFILLPRVANNA